MNIVTESEYSLQMDDLSRMYRLFCRIPKGLEPIAQFFKQVLFALLLDGKLPYMICLLELATMF
jgi:hypothetical protein